MKNLKMFLGFLAISVMLFIIGCNDQVTSSGEPNVNSSNEKSVTEIGNQIDRPRFQTQIRLKPHRGYTFNFENTGLINFNYVNVKRVSQGPDAKIDLDICQDVRVYSNQVEKSELGCFNAKFESKEITVQNTGSSMIEVDVVLLGEKAEISVTK